MAHGNTLGENMQTTKGPEKTQPTKISFVKSIAEAGGVAQGALH